MPASDANLITVGKRVRCGLKVLAEPLSLSPTWSVAPARMSPEEMSRTRYRTGRLLALPTGFISVSGGPGPRPSRRGQLFLQGLRTARPAPAVSEGQGWAPARRGPRGSQPELLRVGSRRGGVQRSPAFLIPRDAGSSQEDHRSCVGSRRIPKH